MELTKDRIGTGQNQAVMSDMTICPKCGTKSKSNTLYCRCGTALNNVCSHCGARNLVSAKSCGGCGTRLL